MTLTLPANAGELWRNLDRSLRDEVITAEQLGLACESGGAELLPDFYDVFAGAVRDRGVPTCPQRWFGEIINRFPERTRVSVVRHGEQAVAGAVTMAFGSSLEILSTAWRRSYRSVCAHSLLHWHIVRQGIDDGARELELGQSRAGDGPFAYRALWGAKPHSTVSEYVRLSGRGLLRDRPKDNWTNGATAVWRHMPLTLANAIGPALARYQP